MDQPSARGHSGGLGRLILGVEAVAQEGPRQAAVDERRLGRVVTGGDDRRVRRLGAEARRVDDVTDSRGSRGVNRCLMLSDAPLEIGRADEQHPLAASERLPQRLRLVEVAEPNVRPVRGEVRD